MPAMSFPRMSAILATWWDLIVSGELLGELVPSLWRMFAGLFRRRRARRRSSAC